MNQTNKRGTGYPREVLTELYNTTVKSLHDRQFYKFPDFCKSCTGSRKTKYIGKRCRNCAKKKPNSTPSDYVPVSTYSR